MYIYNLVNISILSVLQPRGPNWSDAEIIALAQFVSEHRDKLFGKAGHSTAKVSYDLVVASFSPPQKSESVLDHIAVASTSGIVIGMEEDGRRRHNPSNKFDEQYRQKVIDHIESFRPQVSHYKRQHAQTEDTCRQTRQLCTNIFVSNKHRSVHIHIILRSSTAAIFHSHSPAMNCARLVWPMTKHTQIVLKSMMNA